jgi:hypothetical protein
MDGDHENIVCQTLANARAAGRNHWTQIKEATRVIGEVRRDITESEALAMVISNCG